MIKKSIFALVLCTNILFAQNEVSGSLGLSLGKVSIRDNFYSTKDNDKISTLNKKAKKIDENIIFPLLNLEYGDFYLNGNINEQSIGYSWTKDNAVYITSKGLGIKQSFENNMFYSLDYKLEDVYINPYSLNIKRKSKNAKLIELSLGKKGIYNFLDLTYHFKKININDEVNKSEKQSGYSNEVNVMATLLQFNQNSFGAMGFILGNGIFDGNSNDYKKVGLKYEMEINFLNTHRIALENIYEVYTYDKKNSYFNKERDEKVFSLKINYTKSNFLNYKNLVFHTDYISNTRNSNIAFFQSNTDILLISLAYTF
ncbi:MAG: DUF2860 family protein [Campylobacteraceae bacterium]|nr:DUF2860 family protein [Campylobacteraceae bacterium]